MGIRKTLGTIVALAGIGLFSIMPFREAKADVSANIAFKNQYLAGTGAVFSDKPVAYPSLTIFGNGVYGFLGANIGNGEGVNELDYIVGYNRDIGGINLDFAAGFFDLRNFGESNLNDNTSDAWAKLNKKLTPKINLEAGIAQNIEGGTFSNPEGRDLNFALTYKGDSFTGITDIHYNDRYFSPNSGLSVARFSGSTSFDFGNLSITPEALFQLALDRNNFRNNTEARISANYNF